MGTHPRQRVRTLVVTTPANTVEASPQDTTWTVGIGTVERVDVVIPSGHVGLTGLAILWGARQLVPYEGAEWITGDDDEVQVDLGLFVGAGRLVVRTYNLDDTFPHSHHLRAYVVDAALEPADVVVGGFVLPEAPPSELPELDELELGLSAGELVVVSTALEAFLADLQTVLDGFLAQLDARLGFTGELPPPIGEVPTEPTSPAPTPTPTRVEVPDVVGSTLDTGRRRLRAAGFTMQATARRERGREVIVDQQPRAGAMRERGFVVQVVHRVNPA